MLLSTEINRVPSPRCGPVRALLNASQTGALAAVLLVTSPSPAAEKRPVPGYGGPPASGGDGALWIPRVLLAPLWAVWELLVRLPIGAAITAFEGSTTVQRGLHVVSLGGEKNAGLAPTFFVDRGMIPMVGGYFWWDDALVRGNHLRVRAATWGAPVVVASATDRLDLDDRSSIALTASFVRRRDNLFWGIGPDTRDGARGRYRSQVLDVSPGFERALGAGMKIATRVGVRDASLDDRTPRVSDAYTIVYQHAEVAFDTRALRQRSLGLRAVLRGDDAFDVSRAPGRSWVGYGASVEGSWNIGGTARILGLAATTQLVDPVTQGTTVPFTELATLGGNTTMRGFLPGRMFGRSAAAITLSYEWPVWSFLDAELEASTGNAFGARLQGLDPGKLRLSGAAGLRTLAIPEAQLELLCGFGTDTFDQGTRPSSFRLTLGMSHGF